MKHQLKATSIGTCINWKLRQLVLASIGPRFYLHFWKFADFSARKCRSNILSFKKERFSVLSNDASGFPGNSIEAKQKWCLQLEPPESDFPIYTNSNRFSWFMMFLLVKIFQTVAKIIFPNCSFSCSV